MTRAPLQRYVERYGDAPANEGEWWLPAPTDGPAGGLPLVVLVHGGFWKPGYDRHLEDGVAERLAARGFAVWNVDYRSAAEAWPATLVDVAAAADFAADRGGDLRLDLARVAVAGHSAGGHLALWLGSRRRGGPTTAVGGEPRLLPRLVVAQAPVADLALGHRTGLGGGAVARLVGGTPEELPERYALASPVALVRAGGPEVVLVHGDADDTVPLRQSECYAAAARAAGAQVTLEVLPGGGHMEHVDPASPAVDVLLSALERL